MHGILIVDKPEGFTSHDVVAKLRGMLRTKSIGHTGTLDPFATGVLVCLIGKATRLAQFLDKAEKEYLATISFGYSTDTGDHTGSPKSEAQNLKSFSFEEIENALTKFRGAIEQTPPMYSAKKIAGKKLYELARQGKEVERQAVKINISELELIETKDETAIVRVVCSAGTYIRVLGEDIGRELNTGAHLEELRRTRAGNFDLQRAVTLADLQKLADAGAVETILIAPNDALAHLPFVVLGENEVRKTLNGMAAMTDLNFGNNQTMRMIDRQNNLVAVGAFDASENSVKPRIVIGLAAD
jgi:tRNA pseudouridine55 synthase